MIVSKEGASTTVIEVADVFRRYGREYLQKFGERMPPSHRRVFKDILRCRTEAMGGHVFECNHCGSLSLINDESFPIDQPIISRARSKSTNPSTIHR